MIADLQFTTMVILLLTLLCLLSVVANVCILAITIKVYSEVLKIEHVKRIGKKEAKDPNAIVT